MYNELMQIKEKLQKEDLQAFEKKYTTTREPYFAQAEQILSESQFENHDQLTRLRQTYMDFKNELIEQFPPAKQAALEIWQQQEQETEGKQWAGALYSDEQDKLSSVVHDWMSKVQSTEFETRRLLTAKKEDTSSTPSFVKPCKTLAVICIIIAWAQML